VTAACTPLGFAAELPSSPEPEPVDHRTRAHFKKPGHLVSQGATLDDRYLSRPQVVRIWLSLLPKGIRSARLAHPPTFGNPTASKPARYALRAPHGGIAADVFRKSATPKGRGSRRMHHPPSPYGRSHYRLSCRVNAALPGRYAFARRLTYARTAPRCLSSSVSSTSLKSCSSARRSSSGDGDPALRRPGHPCTVRSNPLRSPQIGQSRLTQYFFEKQTQKGALLHVLCCPQRLVEKHCSPGRAQ
jgi:hypothetical protein